MLHNWHTSKLKATILQSPKCRRDVGGDGTRLTGDGQGTGKRARSHSEEQENESSRLEGKSAGKSAMAKKDVAGEFRRSRGINAGRDREATGDGWLA